MSQEEEVKKLKQEVKQLKKEVKHLKKDTWKIKNCLVDHRNEMDRMNIKIENAIRQVIIGITLKKSSTLAKVSR